MGVITDERDEVIRALTRHCGDGRLTLDELEERIAEAYEATSDEELRHALRDLPSESPAPKTARAPEPTLHRTALPPLPPLPQAPHLPGSSPPEWEKAVGTAFCIGGFVLLFNGMFIMAL